MGKLITLYTSTINRLTTSYEFNFQSPQAEELSLLGIQLGSQFLFHSGFHTKKTLRGPAIDWYEALKIPMPLWYAFQLLFLFCCCFHFLFLLTLH